jgi:hypothetical protein
VEGLGIRGGQATGAAASAASSAAQMQKKGFANLFFHSSQFADGEMCCSFPAAAERKEERN